MDPDILEQQAESTGGDNPEQDRASAELLNMARVARDKKAQEDAEEAAAEREQMNEERYGDSSEEDEAEES